MTASAFTSAIRLLEDSLVLLQRVDPLSWLIYFAGVVPFFSVVLFEITDLFQSPFAAEHLLLIALTLALLYFWLNVCQSFFAARVYATLTGQSSSLRKQLAASAPCQLIIAGSKLLAWPIALILIVPHAIVTTFYQHALLVSNEFSRSGWRATLAEAKKDALHHQLEAIWMLVIVLLLRIVLSLNLFVLLFILPALWKTFTGMEGNVTRVPQILVNPTSFTALLVLSYLALDPLVKAACVLRRFHRHSESSGQDLRLRLSLLKRAALAATVLIVLALPRHALAASNPNTPHPMVQADQMKHAITQVFHDPAATWDLPVLEPQTQRSGPFTAFLNTVVQRMKKIWRSVDDAIAAFINWVRKILSGGALPKPQPQHPQSSMQVSMLLALFSALLAIAVLFALWRRRRARPSIVQPIAVSAGPAAITAHDPDPAEQDFNEWIRIAAQYRSQGDFRSALRALYLSSLATLARHGLISLARGKSNRDYISELQRRAKRLGVDNATGAVSAFRSNVRLFEQIWYGMHPATEETLDRFQQNLSAFEKSS
ncbi:MAG: DUF4129 domain-containing protein [Acidobacteriaceae bacterium]|nr:DUF4129 domain-containing protein [Acidobacteriaceae bacterium]